MQAVLIRSILLMVSHRVMDYDNYGDGMISLATELMVHGLLKLSSAVPVCLSSDSSLVLWVLDQQALLSHVGRIWVRGILYILKKDASI